jgi:aminoglycoside 2''-phosphotransferase
VRYFNAGWDYELWEINNELLFRFPLREDCATRLPIEARLLAELADHVSVAIPKPLHVSMGVPPHEWPFFAYRRLAATPLLETQPGDKELEGIAIQLGQFLSELHSFSIERAEQLGVRVRVGARWRQRYVNLRTRVAADVYPLLHSQEAALMEASWEEFLARDEYFAFTPALIHGDLDQAHILLGSGTATVAGVIDFGDALIGDPALDFAGFDRALGNNIAASYALSIDNTLLERAGIYRTRMSPLHGVLFGLDTGAASLVEDGLQQIRQTLSTT